MRHVRRAGGQTGRAPFQAVVELGGCDAYAIFADADLDQAAFGLPARSW